MKQLAIVLFSFLFLSAYTYSADTAEQPQQQPLIKQVGSKRIMESSFKLELPPPAHEAMQTNADKIIVEFQYITCVDENGNPVPSAHNVVFYSPWLGEKKPFADKNNRFYAEELGYTVFAIPDMGYPPAEIVFAGQDELTKSLKLTPKKLLMYGAASGATNSVNYSITHGDRLDAIAAMSPRHWYKKGFEKKDSVARLMIHNWYDGAGNETDLIKADLSKLGMTALSFQTPPDWKLLGDPFFHRAPHTFTQQIFHAFFQDIVELRDANGGKLPEMEKWPIQHKTANGEIRFLPGKRLDAIYGTLPNDLADYLEKPENDKTKTLEFASSAGMENGVVLLMTDPAFQSPMKTLDMVYFLATEGKVKLYTFEAADPDKAYKQAVELLKSPDLRDRPLFVIATGKAGSPAVLAALDSDLPNLKKVTTLGTDPLSRFMDRSLPDESCMKKSVPIIMYCDALTISNPVPDSGITMVNIYTKPGFGGQILPFLKQSVSADAEIKQTLVKKPRLSNTIPEMLEKTKALESKIDAEDAKTVNAYLASMKELRQHAQNLHDFGMLNPSELLQIKVNMVKAQLKYFDTTYANLSPADKNKTKTELLTAIQKDFNNFSSNNYYMYNSGQNVKVPNAEELNKFRNEIANELIRLKGPPK